MTTNTIKLDILKLDLAKRAEEFRKKMKYVKPRNIPYIILEARIKEISRILEVL